MSPLAIVKTEAPDRQSDPLADLMSRRDALHSELGRLQRPEQTRSAALAALNEAEAALGELDRLDRQDWEQWAAKPAGEAPEGRHEARRAAEQKRALAASDVRASEAAVAAVAPRTAELLAELRRLGGQIYETKLSSVLDGVPAIEKAILDAHATMTSNLSQLQGLFDVLIQEKAAADDRHHEANAAVIQSAVARLAAMREPQRTSDWAARQAAAVKWREALR